MQIQIFPACSGPPSTAGCHIAAGTHLTPAAYGRRTFLSEAECIILPSVNPRCYSDYDMNTPRQSCYNKDKFITNRPTTRPNPPRVKIVSKYEMKRRMKLLQREKMRIKTEFFVFVLE